MKNNGLVEKYYVKRGSELYADVTDKFDGVRILKVDGMFDKGEPVNIYNEQWTGNQSEDYMVTTLDDDQNPVVVYKNTDIKVVFAVSTRYADGVIDVGRQHDAFVDYMTNGALWIKSYYANKETYCCCMSGYTPQNIKLQRGLDKNYMIGELTFHQLDLPSEIQIEILGDLYIGLGDATLSDISSLVNPQHHNVLDPSGTYTYALSDMGYLWICTSATIDGVTSSGYEVPLNGSVVVGNLRCYRTTNKILPHTMSFTITSNQ